MGNCLGGGSDDDDTAPLREQRRSASRHPSEAPVAPEPPSAQRSLAPDLAGDGASFASVITLRGSTAPEMSEQEQLVVARRLTLLDNLPVDTFLADGKGDKECIICMVDFVEGDRIRFLPCLHSYHVDCIDDWLMRKLACPSCMEPIDSALLSSFHGAPLDDIWSLSSSPATAPASSSVAAAAAAAAAADDEP